MGKGSSGVKDFKVAIVGGGICGLACAVGLLDAGIQVDIYEAASKFGEIGAGVGFGPNAIHVLQELGVLEDVIARSDQQKLTQRPFKFVSGYGEHELIYDYPVEPEDLGLGIHRAAFLDALVHRVDVGRTHFNKRCVSLSIPANEANKVDITFADGTSTMADVVLGADGIRSTVRAFVVSGNGDGLAADEGDGEGDEDSGDDRAGLVHQEANSQSRENHTLLAPVRTAYSRTLAYRALVPTAVVEAAALHINLASVPLCFMGRGSHIITFPIKGGETINIVAFTQDQCSQSARPLPSSEWVTERSVSELRSIFADYGEDARRLLQCVERPRAWAVHVVSPPLGRYSRGRVALLGDAAHGMLPHLGAGAGQGLEDALVLVRLLAHPATRTANVDTVLAAYSHVRHPRANAVLRASARAGKVYDDAGPEANCEMIRQRLDGIWESVWRWDVQGDIIRGQDSLEDACGSNRRSL